MMCSVSQRGTDLITALCVSVFSVTERTLSQLLMVKWESHQMLQSVQMVKGTLFPFYLAFFKS